MRKLYCPECSTPEPTIEKVSGYETKSTGRRILEWILFLIPGLGDFFFAGEIVTDLKKYPTAECNKCNHKWRVKARA
jgi:DNA-directed RNA polymerase subunit RPC12/RpoP